MARLLELEELPIRVTARGEWRHGQQPLHPRVAELFKRNLVPRADGTYIVKLGFNEAVLEIEDTAYFVTHVAAEERDGRLLGVRLWISDGAEELLDPETLMQSADNVLYCRLVRHGLRVPARFSAAQYHGLALHADERAGAVQLEVDGRWYRFAPYDARIVAA